MINVITPVRSFARCTFRTVDKILAQRFNGRETIVFDGSSTDNIREVRLVFNFK